MIFGDKAVFAIESEIAQVYAQLSIRALGFFVIYVKDKRYGVRNLDASLLACSYDAVKRRIVNRGRYIANFAKMDAEQVGSAFYNAVYSEDQADTYFGTERSVFQQHFEGDEQNILWAPDGDAAFDDGSYVIHFDVDNQVRLIAFRSIEKVGFDTTSLAEVMIPADAFYEILRDWCSWFDMECKLREKVPVP